MKTSLLFSFFFSLMIISVYGQDRREGVPMAGQTAIRSVVAQAGELRLLLHVAAAGSYELDIYSADGEMIYRQTVEERVGEVEQCVALRGRVHGVYVVNLTGAGGQCTRQVMW